MTKKNRRAAFTLVELIVVLAILAVLLIVIVPRVTGYVSEARETAAQNNASAILRAAELYVVDQEGDGKIRQGPTPTAAARARRSTAISIISMQATATHSPSLITMNRRSTISAAATQAATSPSPFRR